MDVLKMPRTGVGLLGFLRPLVARVAAHQFAAHLRVEALPEAREVAGGLHSALVGREQMHNHWGAAGADARCLLHAEEILQTAGDPRRFAAFVMHARPAATGEANLGRGKLLQLSRADLLLDERGEAFRRTLELGKAAQALAKLAQRRFEYGRGLAFGSGLGKAGHFSTDDQLIERGEVGEAGDARLDCFCGKHYGGGLGILGRAAMLIEEHLIVVESADLLDALGTGVPFEGIKLAHARREELDEPYGFDARGEANERQRLVTAILGLNGCEERIGRGVGGEFG